MEDRSGHPATMAFFLKSSCHIARIVAHADKNIPIYSDRVDYPLFPTLYQLFVTDFPGHEYRSIIRHVFSDVSRDSSDIGIQKSRRREFVVEPLVVGKQRSVVKRKGPEIGRDWM